jgi:hypothetical protein
MIFRTANLQRVLFKTILSAVTVVAASGALAAVEPPALWLTAPPSAGRPAAPSDFLDSLHGAIRPLICKYDGSTLTNVSAPADAGQWNCSLRADKTADGGLALAVAFKLETGAADSTGVAVAFDFSRWSQTNYVFAPAMLYDGNRFRIVPMGYPPYLHDPAQRPLDMPVTTTDVLHLNAGASPGLVEMKTFNCSTPAMGFFSPADRRGFLLLAEPGTRLGVSGMLLQEDPAAGRMAFVVSAPGVRRLRYSMCGRAPSGDAGARWAAGDELTLKFRLYNFPAANLPAFFTRFFDVRKALTGSNAVHNVTPFSAAADILAAHHDLRKWQENEKFGYYSNRPGNASPFAHQIGWSGVPVYSHAAFLNATPERLRRGSRSLDYLVTAQAPSGLFYAMDHNGEPIGDEFGKMEQHRSVALIRRSGEALGFGLRQLELLRARGQADKIKPEWERMFRRCAEGLLQLQATCGQFGQFVDVDTGKVEINGSTAGSACISGLALAAKYFNDPKYLQAAEKAGEFYYQRDLARGYSGGGPAEILQAPDSESAYNLCDAYMALYDLTGKTLWRDHAGDAIHLLATWMVSYDYAFPPNSSLGRTGVKAAGSIFASSQNNHSAPGLYIHSGDFLLKYFRATGDARVAELYRDTCHNVVQYLNTRHNPLQPGAPEGFATERVQLSDWEGGDFGQIPNGDSNMAWETLIELTCLQNPGIYLNTDDARLLVLDHVEASTIKREGGRITLRVFNPTPYDANIAILAESSKQAEKPLDSAACLRWPRLQVQSGATATVVVSPDGAIAPAPHTS